MKNLLFPALLSLAALAPACAQSTQTRAVPTFHAIQVGTGIELALTAGRSQHVEVSAATDAYRDHIETTVKDGVLILRYKNDDDRYSRDRTNKHLRVAVTADELTALSASSGSSVRTAGDFDAATFQLDISSGASVQAGLDTGTLTVRQSSGSSADLKGRATSLDVQSSSGATFDAHDLRTDRCRAQASSGSSVRVAVKDDLVAQASSGGSISYQGSPQLTKRTSSGGSVSGR
ncbi:head GIN domain-containing protein [Hymenobacter cheonanensis]|uniref:head GIN domain-containing protein n=1 Tax=Hymenobacter sp. CA2-7 TaxID=3063993 RepID=UPI002712DED9|nr:head GIN domain-containing protein [Hymenobacter sp. CA2-7]MDO7887446.1 head GIN domain-containing protein [Hymenobacter sp. CA2-7]